MSPINRAEIRFSVIVVALVGLLPGCGKQQDAAAWWAGEQERTELSQQLELQKFRFEEIYAGDIARLGNFHAESKATHCRVDSLRHEQQELNGVVESLQRRLAEFKESTLRSQRQQAMQETFPTFSLASGRRFENVTISAIDDAGVTIRHTHGSARLRFQDLDAKQQQFFGLEEDLAHLAHAEEAHQLVAYERWAAKQTEITRLNETATAQVNQRREVTSLQKQLDSPAPQIIASNVSTLAQPAKSVGSGSQRNYRYSSYRNYRPTWRYIYDDGQNCSNHTASEAIVCPPQYYPLDHFRKPIASGHKSFFPDTTLPSNP